MFFVWTERWLEGTVLARRLCLRIRRAKSGHTIPCYLRATSRIRGKRDGRTERVNDLLWYVRSESLSLLHRSSFLTTLLIASYQVKCYRHGGNEYNLRAKLEDLLEIEKRRAGKMLSRQDAPMKFAHASRLLFSAIGVLRILGWAWRWAEFWVDYNSSWEPLLEPGEDEEKMTKEELKIVDSTRDSRCLDARNCRLAAFGAALRNRSYDEGDDYQREAFNAALTSILETKSLVGPLTDVEKEFFTQWISLAYWSKSRYLCFGEDKVEVNEDSPFVVHAKDKSPKFKLSSRSLPGTASGTSEVDDFLLRELMTDDLLPTLRRGRNSPKVSAASTRRSSRRHETGDSPNECSSPMIDKAAGQMNDIMEVVCVDEDIPVTPLTKES